MAPAHLCKGCSAGAAQLEVTSNDVLGCSTDSPFLGNVTKQKVALTLPDNFLLVLLGFFLCRIFKI